MAKAKEKESVELSYEQMDLCTEGLNLLKEKLTRAALISEGLKIEKSTAAIREQEDKIEDLKTKFLHS